MVFWLHVGCKSAKLQPWFSPLFSSASASFSVGFFFHFLSHLLSEMLLAPGRAFGTVRIKPIKTVHTCTLLCLVSFSG